MKFQLKKEKTEIYIPFYVKSGSNGHDLYKISYFRITKEEPPDKFEQSDVLRS